MKKVLFIAFICLLYNSCSDAGFSFNPAERVLTRFTVDNYDFNGDFNTVDSLIVQSGRFISNKRYSFTGQFINSTNWYYNANGLMSRVEYFDHSQGVTITDPEVNIQYDSNNRIISEGTATVMRNFAYNNNTITETIINDNTPNTPTIEL